MALHIMMMFFPPLSFRIPEWISFLNEGGSMTFRSIPSFFAMLLANCLQLNKFFMKQPWTGVEASSLRFAFFFGVSGTFSSFPPPRRLLRSSSIIVTISISLSLSFIRARFLFFLSAFNFTLLLSSLMRSPSLFLKQLGLIFMLNPCLLVVYWEESFWLFDGWQSAFAYKGNLFVYLTANYLPLEG